jgi:hypothetical protein
MEPISVVVSSQMLISATISSFGFLISTLYFNGIPPAGSQPLSPLLSKEGELHVLAEIPGRVVKEGWNHHKNA